MGHRPSRVAMRARSLPIVQIHADRLADEPPARKLLCMLILLAIKDRSSRLTIESRPGSIRVSYTIDGSEHELVPPPDHLGPEIARTLRGMLCPARSRRRLAEALRSWAARLDRLRLWAGVGTIGIATGLQTTEAVLFVMPTMEGEDLQLWFDPVPDRAAAREAQQVLGSRLEIRRDARAATLLHHTPIEPVPMEPTLTPPERGTLAGTASDIWFHRTSCRDRLDACLALIDVWEPRVQAWVYVNREGARRQADMLDAELAADQHRGPLHGIPVGIKDIIDVAGLPTACGSVRWKGREAREDAPLVARLRKAGAIIVGKTVTTPYAWIDPPPTRNPWKLDRTPGGSSSGSAAALACGMVLGALGSQTGGSITRPASFCGVCGLKPTHGRLPVRGILPFATSLDHPGPMARTINDLSILWQALAGPDPRDRRPLAPDAPIRLGRLRGFFDERAEPSMREALEGATDAIRSVGLTVVERDLPAPFESIHAEHRLIMAAEAAGVHEDWLREHPDDYPPRIRELIEEGLGIPAARYARARGRQQALIDSIGGLFEGIDALVTPAAIGPAPGPDTTGDPMMNSPWSYTGLPTVNFPIGLSPDGLPLGIQLVGDHFAEAQLLEIARRCEAALRAKAT
jgi:aspartyl-tRNA(Asn)/glutamyl-tRNA(Gln) amidotransferase subunit A